MNIVISTSYGGFGLSHQAILRLAELKGLKLFPVKGSFSTTYYTDENNTQYFFEQDIERNDPHLVQVVEELLDKADGSYAKLKIVQVPDDVKWHIKEYGGYEHVAEDHRVWR